MDAPVNVPLVCRLGRHKPRATTRWNNGFYFTRCGRCGQDLVRTAFGRWQVPRGYRIVWQAQAPANAASAELVRAREAPDDAGARELPIQEVLRHVQNGDKAGHAPGGRPEPDAVPAPEPSADAGDAAGDAPVAAPKAAARAVRGSRIPDFMNEAAGADGWQAPARRYLVRTPPLQPAQDGQDTAAAERGTGRLKERFAALFARAPDPEGDEDEAPPAASRAPLAALAIMVVLVLLALTFWGGRPGSGSAAVNDSLDRGAPIAPDHGQPAFVTASLLNCRAAPAREAETVEILTRGDAVRLLARDGEWVSLVDRGGQCWALIRFFSVERPIQGRPS